MLRAEGEAQAITSVFEAIHAGQPDQALLAYQYMQMLPKLANGDSNKMWIVPSELNDAMKGLGQIAGGEASDVREYVSKAAGQFAAPEKVDVHAEIEAQAEKDRKRSDATVEKAIADAQALEQNKLAKRQASPAQPPALSSTPDPAPVKAPERDAPGATTPLGEAQQIGRPVERPDFDQP